MEGESQASGDALDETLADPLVGAGASRDELGSAEWRSPDDEGRPRAPGARCGRFVVLEELGAGAMGQVYAAYDPQLDRRVALKLIRAGGSAELAGARSARLVREARAIARLSHPNVVAVFEVGTVDDEVFIATEQPGLELGAEPRRALVEVGGHGMRA